MPVSHCGNAYAGCMSEGIDPTTALPERMAQGLAAFSGPVLLIMSGNDLTAREFDEVTRTSAEWKPLLARAQVDRQDLEAADHTFSRADWTDTINRWTTEWVGRLDAPVAAKEIRQARAG